MHEKRNIPTDVPFLFGLPMMFSVLPVQDLVDQVVESGVMKVQ
jgi:hypothetical protein